MKIAIATPEQAGEGWTPFLTEFLHPVEIRSRILTLLAREKNGEPQFKIVTLNRTVLDMVNRSGYGEEPR